MNIPRTLKDIRVGKESLEKLGFRLAVNENNLRQVHFLMPGPLGTVYEGGLYHGLLTLSAKHPMEPPTIHMFTPTGRFTCSNFPTKGNGICTTNTVYHRESWTPLNNIENILIGFQSFMVEKSGGIGSQQQHDKVCKQLAKESHQHNQEFALTKQLFFSE